MTLSMPNDGTVMSEQAKDWSRQYCDDGTFVPASPEMVFDALLDVAHWNDWWVMMRFVPEGGGPLETGKRVEFDGGVSRWLVEVGEIERPLRIALRYAAGDLIGDAEWRIAPEQGGCRVSYAYLGVCAAAERPAATFGRFGTRLHTMVMQTDALPGLVRLLAGKPLDETWRQSVRDSVRAGREAMIALEGLGDEH
jgi:uncharacterized protein YndB with AHSA1/START domain